ncbi:hypothetical protein Bca4012_011328 [Brassica carinata]
MSELRLNKSLTQITPILTDLEINKVRPVNDHRSQQETGSYRQESVHTIIKKPKTLQAYDQKPPENPLNS